MKKKLRIAIVAARFNPEITEGLLRCCVNELKKNGVSPKNILIDWVPGAYELPFAAHQWARRGAVQAVIALGCIIKGDTSHDAYIAQWSSLGIGLVSILTGTPVVFGVLTPKNESQARARSRPGPLDRGKEMAQTALALFATYPPGRR